MQAVIKSTIQSLFGTTSAQRELLHHGALNGCKDWLDSALRARSCQFGMGKRRLLLDRKYPHLEVEELPPAVSLNEDLTALCL